MLKVSWLSGNLNFEFHSIKFFMKCGHIWRTYKNVAEGGENGELLPGLCQSGAHLFRRLSVGVPEAFGEICRGTESCFVSDFCQ